MLSSPASVQTEQYYLSAYIVMMLSATHLVLVVPEVLENATDLALQVSILDGV